jgi:L-rhamnose mutarotase
MRLKPGAGAEYARLHEDLPDAMLEQLERAGVRNYTIFLDGEDLFAYLEAGNLERFRSVMREGAPQDDWVGAVRDLFAAQAVDPDFGLPPRLHEVFRFDPDDAPGETG